jgi:hypothetical protein
MVLLGDEPLPEQLVETPEGLLALAHGRLLARGVLALTLEEGLGPGQLLPEPLLVDRHEQVTGLDVLAVLHVEGLDLAHDGGPHVHPGAGLDLAARHERLPDVAAAHRVPRVPVGFRLCMIVFLGGRRGASQPSQRPTGKC